VQFTGITCRLDVIELLEKRVKSRFSHRQIFLFLGEEGGNNLDHRLERLQQFLLIPSDAKLDVTPSFKKLWNNHIDLLLRDKNFKNAMQRLLDLDLSEKSLKNILVSLFHDLLYYNRIVHLIKMNYENVSAKESISAAEGVTKRALHNKNKEFFDFKFKMSFEQEKFSLTKT
jgi:hypothetical protein